MGEFGDYDPEDAWHPDDPVPELLTNIRHRIEALIEDPDPDPARLSRRLLSMWDDVGWIMERVNR